MIYINNFKSIFWLAILSFLCINVDAQNSFADSLKVLVNEARQKQIPEKQDVKNAVILTDFYSKISLDTSKYYGNAALKLSLKLKNDTALAMANNILGMAYLTSGFFDSAFPYMDTALVLLSRLKDTTGIVFVRNNMAVANMRNGNYKEALSLYQENLRIAQERKEYESMLLAYNNMGITYYDWKKYDEALKNYNYALDVLDSLGEENRKGSIYNNIGELLKAKGDEKQALDMFKKALVIHEKYNRQRSILISTMNIGDIYLDRKQFNDALEYLERALTISEQIPDYANMALLNIKLGKLYVNKNNAARAGKYLKEGMKIASEKDYRSELLEAYKMYIDYALLLNDAKLMYKYTELYNKLNDSLFSDESLKAISEMETRFKTAEKEREIAVLNVEQQNKDLEIQMQRNQKYLIVILLLLILIFGFLLFNRNRLKQIKEKAEMEKQKISIEQRMLRAQMNPHFIFNSLNSINNFIGSNDGVQAQNFLSKFARLMRLILENSRKSMVSLESEIQTLRLNLELEQMRFNNNFDFSINIEDEIDEEECWISPMLLQPFVENAIKHGLKKDEKGGFIKIDISLKGDMLYCEIEDNGIGRDASAQRSLNGGRQHNSLGTKVTLERFEILRHDFNKDAGFEIIDLKDDDGNAKGTKVVVRLPWEGE